MKRSRAGTQPTMMIHHIREIQLRFLAVGLVLAAGMVAGYFFYEPLFAFIKAPLNSPLHYMSPAGSFNLIIKVCLMVGVIVALPVAVYNLVMFLQPALRERLSQTRVHIVTLTSFILASLGAAFAFFVIIPLALKFFYKFQVDGLVALISADEYLRFVMSVVITFIIIFQLPLLISFIDHIRPLPPKKLFKAEKFIIVGSVFIGVLVPFALDPAVQLLIASPIIILYNLSIGIVLLQQRARRRYYVTPPPEPVATLRHVTRAETPPIVASPVPKPVPSRPRRTMDIVKSTT